MEGEKRAFVEVTKIRVGGIEVWYGFNLEERNVT